MTRPAQYLSLALIGYVAIDSAAIRMWPVTVAAVVVFAALAGALWIEEGQR